MSTHGQQSAHNENVSCIGICSTNFNIRTRLIIIYIHYKLLLILTSKDRKYTSNSLEPMTQGFINIGLERKSYQLQNIAIILS